MGAAITYKVNNNLYINLTNKCTNRCTFCVRNTKSGVRGASDGIELWLDHEPSIEEVMNEVKEKNPDNFEQIVFCGYGEPMMRMNDIVEICKEIRKISNIPIKINTNGQANLYFKEDITPKLKGLVDIVSISLNAKEANEYQEICQSRFGLDAFGGIIDFARNCTKNVPQVVFTVVDILSKEDISACQKIAEEVGADFRIRPLGV